MCVASLLLLLLLIHILVFHQIHCHILYRVCRPAVEKERNEMSIYEQVCFGSPLLCNCRHGVQEDGDHGVVEVGTGVQRLHVHTRPRATLSSVAVQNLLQY